MRMIVSDIPDPKKERENKGLFTVGSASLLNNFLRAALKSHLYDVLNMQRSNMPHSKDFFCHLHLTFKLPCHLFSMRCL